MCIRDRLGDELGAHVIAKGSGSLVEHVLVGATDDLGDLVLLGAVEDGRRGEEPVSYTHLDVYKRQGRHNVKRLSHLDNLMLTRQQRLKCAILSWSM